MFERKNQSILTPHYAALVSHDHEDADEVFTLARRDHALDVEEAASDREGITQPLTSSGDLSKRKLKAGSSRKGQLRTRPAPEKVVFDDQGMTREFYEAGKDAESGAGADAKRKAYMDAERDKMRIADRLDRQVARERKKERKRKRKEREMEVSVNIPPKVCGTDLAIRLWRVMVRITRGGLRSSEPSWTTRTCQRRTSRHQGMSRIRSGRQRWILTTRRRWCYNYSVVTQVDACFLPLW